MFSRSYSLLTHKNRFMRKFLIAKLETFIQKYQ